MSYKNSKRIAALIVLVVSFAVYFMSAERTGSLWDCGEFILGAHKLQVVHPPGAPLFLLIARLFAAFADMISSNPEHIAFAVNLSSGLSSAGAAALICLITMMFGNHIINKNRTEKVNTQSENIVLIFSGVVAGLSTAFATSIWFSAVEGEVYAMSTFFTALTVFTMVKWYFLPDTRANDKWLILACLSSGLSIGVHLLSLLAFPILGLMIYFKKYKNHNILGGLISLGIGAIMVPLIQKVIIVGIPQLWKAVEIPMVNSFGLPVNSGILVTVLILAALLGFGIYYSHKKANHTLNIVLVSTLMIIIGYSTIGMVVVRANADTPINMNIPSDVTRLIPYINREQYGERSLFYGPYYGAQAISYDRESRKGIVDLPPAYNRKGGAKYVSVDEKITPQFAAKDKMFFPRLADNSMNRPAMYKRWGVGEGKPSLIDNISFFVNYQMNYMFWRYFMWNFAGRQNGLQGRGKWNKSTGHWESGIKVLDEARLYDMDELPRAMKENKSRNHYYLLPLLFGIIGLIFQFKSSRRDFLVVFILFLITGIGITLYINSPPSEPRERDYIFTGSTMAFTIWIGLAVIALYSFLKDRVQNNDKIIGVLAGVIVLAAPVIMGFQNMDDHSRKDHKASRDYASNFLNSVDPNAIIFTYGDNDTYPLWYAQEVEGIRPDVRVVNLSLIAVDWYINKLRARTNDSPPLKLTIPAEAYRGNKRNNLPFYAPNGDRYMDAHAFLKFIGSNNPLSSQGGQMKFESYAPTHKIFIPTNYSALQNLGILRDSTITNRIEIDLTSRGNFLYKNDLAVLDIIVSNIWERPVYFSVTCQNAKLLGINDYMQLEGLSLRIVPIKSQSDPTMFIYGSGKVNIDKAYENIMEKWRWGNFDKKDLFVNSAYAAATQSMRMTMMRLAEELMRTGQRQKAVQVANKYFEAFPNMNFTYDVTVTPFISILLRGGDVENAKNHLRTLAQETQDHLNFYTSIDPDVLKSSFQQEYGMRLQAANQINQLANATRDQEFITEMNNLVSSYLQNVVPN